MISVFALKKYPEELELNSLTPKQRNELFEIIYDRDIISNKKLHFRGVKIEPFSHDEISNKVVLGHLTSVTVDYKTKKREYCPLRSRKLHWVITLIEENTAVKVFSHEGDQGMRTYIWDKKRDFIVVLKPKKNKLLNEDGEIVLDEKGQPLYGPSTYYLLSANDLSIKVHRDKIKSKYKNRLPVIY